MIYGIHEGEAPDISEARLQLWRRLKIQAEFLENLARTLSKILCKWKQDSVISSFLYLDSVLKDNHKLVHNQAPV